MAKALITESYLEDIGDAIRAKLESEDTYKPSEMANAIMQISGGGGETKNIWGGTTEPETIQGVNGDIYIKYTENEGTPIDAAYLKVNGTWIPLENGDWSNVNTEGSDNVVWVETSSPTQAQGIIGDIWIKYMDASVITTRSYTLNIIDGLRGSAVLHYVGAHEIELIYDDGEGNEVNIRTLPNFAHTCNRQSANAAFDGNTAGTYWEANPTPVVVEFSATVPSTYTLKKFVVWQRQGSYNTDVWSDFELSETIANTTRTLLAEYGLGQSDWAGAGYGTEWDLSNIPNLRYIITNTYAKIGDSEESAEWTETPIEVTIGGGGGSTSIVLLDEEQTQSSGGSLSIDETVTISEARDYYIICYGYANNVEVYINGVLQSNNLDNSGDYYHAYSQKKTLSVGDVVRVSISSSGKSNLRAFIAAL